MVHPKGSLLQTWAMGLLGSQRQLSYLNVTSKETAKFPDGDLGMILPLGMQLEAGILQELSLGSILDEIRGRNLSKVVADKNAFPLQDYWLPGYYVLVVTCQMKRT